MASRWIMLGAFFCAHGQASAQDIGPVFDMGMLTNTLSIDAVTQSEDRRARKTTPVPQRNSPAGFAQSAISDVFAGRHARTGAAPRLTFTSTPALRQQVLRGYLSRIARRHPVVARDIAAQFARYDASEIYRGISAPLGLRDDDTADILTGYTVLGWLIATGAPDPSPSAIRAARSQIATGLAASPQLSRPAIRAQLGEELKLLFVTLHAGWQSARLDGTLEAYSASVAKMFKAQSGNELRSIGLTEAGFGRR